MKAKKLHTKENLASSTYGAFIQGRLHHALLREKESLEEQGFDVPCISISVKADNRIPFQPKKLFTKLYEDYLENIQRDYSLSLAEKGIILTLIPYISYEDNLLCLPTGIAIHKKDLLGILELAHNAVDKHMDSLVRKGVFAKVKVKRAVNYYLNPYIAYRGTKIDNTLINIFKNP